MEPPNEQSSAEPALRKRLSHYAFVAAGVAIFVWTLHRADISRSAELIASLGLTAAVVLVPQGIWTVVHAGGWRRVLAVLGHRVSLWPLTSTFFSAEAARLTFPAGPAVGESLSAVLLRRRFGVPLSDGVASLATKKLLVVSTNVVYAALGVALAWEPLAAASRRMFGGPVLLWLMAGATGSLLALSLAMGWSMRRGSLAMAVFRTLRALPLQPLRRYLDARKARWAQADTQLAKPLAGRRLAALIPPGALMLLQWLLEAAETWLILHLLGVPITPAEALALEVAGSTLRSLAFAIPAGLGVQDAGYVAMLGAFGVPAAATVGVAFVLLKRSKELFWMGLGWVLVVAHREASPVAKAGAEVERT